MNEHIYIEGYISFGQLQNLTLLPEDIVILCQNWTDFRVKIIRKTQTSDLKLDIFLDIFQKYLQNVVNFSQFLNYEFLNNTVLVCF